MGKLNREDAKQQLKRLSANPALFPQTPDGHLEILKCLERNCTDREHAERTMTRVLDACTDPRNLTAEIAGAASETRAGQVLPDGCDTCSLGKDPQTGAQRWSSHVYAERNGYTCAVRCSCARGEWLRRRDQERGAQLIEAIVRPNRPDFAKLAAGDVDE